MLSFLLKNGADPKTIYNVLIKPLINLLSKLLQRNHTSFV